MPDSNCLERLLKVLVAVEDHIRDAVLFRLGGAHLGKDEDAFSELVVTDIELRDTLQQLEQIASQGIARAIIPPVGQTSSQWTISLLDSIQEGICIMGVTQFGQNVDEEIESDRLNRLAGLAERLRGFHTHLANQLRIGATPEKERGHGRGQAGLSGWLSAGEIAAYYELDDKAKDRLRARLTRWRRRHSPSDGWKEIADRGRNDRYLFCTDAIRPIVESLLGKLVRQKPVA